MGNETTGFTESVTEVQKFLYFVYNCVFFNDCLNYVYHTF